MQLLFLIVLLFSSTIPQPIDLRADRITPYQTAITWVNVDPIVDYVCIDVRNASSPRTEPIFAIGCIPIFGSGKVTFNFIGSQNINYRPYPGDEFQITLYKPQGEFLKIDTWVSASDPFYGFNALFLPFVQH